MIGTGGLMSVSIDGDRPPEGVPRMELSSLPISQYTSVQDGPKVTVPRPVLGALDDSSLVLSAELMLITGAAWRFGTVLLFDIEELVELCQKTKRKVGSKITLITHLNYIFQIKRILYTYDKCK